MHRKYLNLDLQISEQLILHEAEFFLSLYMYVLVDDRFKILCECVCVCIYTSPKAAQLQWAFDAQSVFRKVEIWNLVMMSFQRFRKNETRT